MLRVMPFRIDLSTFLMIESVSGAGQSVPPSPPRPDPRDTEPRREATSLAARLEAAERAEREQAAREQAADEGEDEPAARPIRTLSENPDDDDAKYLIGSDGRSFYSRHSAKLPRLEGDGGRSALSVIGDMRPDPEPKGRKGRRRKGK